MQDMRLIGIGATERTGRETDPAYEREQIVRIIANAAKWAADERGAKPFYGNAEPLERILAK
ncbi:hypothetical protein ACF3MZ_30820 [Paenibacillaceae bacterium WGS1546]|uniref:hypothetical protein n=1 Tax=Cohnella sp. WGS1546 TaxID=3366810 RepID=UPI00372CFA0C